MTQRASKILIIVHRFNAGSGFIYRKNSTAKNFNYYLPSGLGYIISSLNAAGFRGDVINLNHNEGTVKEIIQATVRKETYDLIFMGGVSLYYPAIRDLIRYIREASTYPRIVVGGGLITAQPETMFDMLRPDIAVIGEGEISCVEIAQGIPLQEIKGIIFRNSDGFRVKTERREPIADLDALPFPGYGSMGLPELLDNTKCSYIYDHFDYPRPYPILASRGCTHACTFCFHTVGGKYRQRSIGNIMDEVRFAIEKYRINLFFFYDELFSADEGRAIEFCRQYREFIKTVPWEVKFTVELRVDGITPALLDALKESGCDMVCLGLESYSQEVLNSMRKHITPDQIRTAIEMITAKGMVPVGNFIFGDTKETLETAEKTLKFFRCRQDILHGIRVTFIIPFQGSQIYKTSMAERSDEAFAEHRAACGYDFHEPVNMTSLSARDFEKLKDLVFTAHYTQGTYSPMIAIRGGEILCRCPICDRVSKYNNMVPPGRTGMVNVGCRKCGSRFEMTGHLFPEVQWAIRTFGFMQLYRLRKAVFGWL